LKVTRGRRVVALLEMELGDEVLDDEDKDEGVADGFRNTYPIAVTTSTRITTAAKSMREIPLAFESIPL
jgi:hypothetical protein